MDCDRIRVRRCRVGCSNRQSVDSPVAGGRGSYSRSPVHHCGFITNIARSRGYSAPRDQRPGRRSRDIKCRRDRTLSVARGTRNGRRIKIHKTGCQRGTGTARIINSAARSERVESEIHVGTPMCWSVARRKTAQRASARCRRAGGDSPPAQDRHAHTCRKQKYATSEGFNFSHLTVRRQSPRKTMRELALRWIQLTITKLVTQVNSCI